MAARPPATRAVPSPLEWEYAPAPEARDIVSLEDRYGLYIGGEHVAPRSRKWFADDLALDRGASRRGRPRRAHAMSTSRSRPPAVRSRTAGRRCARPSGRSTCSGIARLIQERSRELAVAESLDGGKPIKESRDVDIPLAAAHFFYYAGWADKLEYAFPNRSPRPLGVAGQIIPWNFPLLMLAWKIAPALACGNTVVLKPAETTPLTALIFTDICRQAELPRGCRQHRHRRRLDRRPPRQASRASTRSRSRARPRSGRRSGASSRAPA